VVAAERLDMTKFILILTLYGGNMSGFANIETVPFQSQAECEAAARAWNTSLKDWVNRSAICVKG